MAARDLDLATLDALGAWVIVLDPRGQVLQANRALVAESGRGSDDWVGRPVAELFELGEDSTAAQRILADVAAHSFPNRYRGTFRTGDGRLMSATWVNSALFDEDGEVAAIVGTAIGDENDDGPAAMLLESEDRFQALARCGAYLTHLTSI